MNAQMKIRLADLNGPARWFVTVFLVTIMAGYLAGVYFVYSTTQGTPTGTVQRFRGNENIPVEEVQEIKYPKPTAEMLNIIHTHVTSYALIYLAVGGLFLFSSYGPKVKAFLTVEPFLGTLLLFGGMAGLRYLGEGAASLFAYVMLAAGLLTFGCFLAMVGLSLWELWRPRRDEA